MTDMIITGIDEAGLGPILGPLIVSSAAFRVPDDKKEANFWRLLSTSVSASKKRLAGRLLICDSKKAYTPAIGIAFLEKTVLSCLEILNKTPKTVMDLVDALCPACKERLLQYPWHKEPFIHRIKFNKDDIAISAGAFGRNLEKHNMSLVSLNSFCFDVAYYNDMINKINNKSTVLFMAVCGLIDRTIKENACENYHFIIDHQGGRTKYTRHLRTMFPEMELKVLKEDSTISSYQLSTEPRPSGSGIKNIKLDFAVKADNDFLPVSLASMAGKYLREQLMICINNYFVQKCRNLRPTAGYWTDGKRFINDLKTIAPEIQYNPHQLIRCR